MKTHLKFNKFWGYFTFLTCITIFLFNHSIAFAQVARLQPVDETANDSSFLEFRDSLLAAVKRQDTTFLSHSLHPEPLFTHWDNKVWFTRSFSGPKGYKKWNQLAETLSLGGRFTHPDTFVAPYVTAAWPDEFDCMTHVVAVGDSVPVYAELDTSSPVVTFLSSEIAETDTVTRWYVHNRHNMVRLRLKGGKRGFMSLNQVRSPLDQRIYFVRHRGEWRIKYLVEGHTPPAPEIKLYPVDEAEQDSSFLAFRNRLKQAVSERDTTFVLGILHPALRYTFGDGAPGREGFKEFWKLGVADTVSGLWKTMQRVISMGGSFADDTNFIAPYVFSDWPRASIRRTVVDPYFFVAITETDVPVHERPDSSSAIIVRKSYNIVFQHPDSYKYGDWTKICTMNATPGFIRKSQCYNPINYRACFIKSDGRWLLRYFIAGD